MNSAMFQKNYVATRFFVTISNMEILITNKSEDYELLDSGEGQKLERYGSVVLARPDNQALWNKKLSEDE